MKNRPGSAMRTARHLSHKNLPLACAVAALLPASMAFAADTLEEIVVTAQFKEQNLQETPIAITAVSGEMLEARNQTSLATVSAQAPNVVLYETGGAYGPGMSATIRGIGQNDFTPAMEPGVGLYVDDVYYPSLTGANFNLLDLERVEILRGPQGTLAGRNSEGGAIKIYSVKPKGDNTGSARVTWGSRNLLETRAIGDFSIIDNTLFARISGVSHKQNGYVKRLDYGCANPGSGTPINTQMFDCLLGTEGGKDYTGGRLALRWLASDSLEVNFNVDLTQDNSEVAATTLIDSATVLAPPPFPPGTRVEDLGQFDPNFPRGDGKQYIPNNPYVSYASFCGYRFPAGQTFCVSPYTKTKVWGSNLTLDWTLSDSLALKSITAYREFDSRWTEDNDTSPASVALGSEHHDNHSFSQELRLSGKLSSIFDYTVGTYYFDQTTHGRSHQMLNFVIPPPGSSQFEFYDNNLIKASSYAVFANSGWSITDALTLNTGVRYTKEKKDFTYGRLGLDGNPFVFGGPTQDGQFSRSEASRTDYRINIDYQWTSNLMTYASFASGFKGGGTNPRPFVVPQIIPFKPEKLTAYEVGLKADWLDNRLRTNISLFNNKYKDIQILLTNCPETSPVTGFPPGFPCARPANAGDAEIKGIELEATYRPITGLAIDGSYSHLNFKYTKLDPNTFDPVTGQPPGPNGPGQVKSKYSIGIQYDMPIGTAILTPRLDFSYQGGFSSPINPINTPDNHVPGYHLLNGQITWKPASESWQVSVAGKNLTNKVYYTNIFELLSQGGWKYGMIAPPREYQVQIQKKF